MNGWKRMSRTTANEERFQRYLRTFGSHTLPSTVKRLARYVTWRGVTRDEPRGVYRELARIGQQDYNNSVLIELGWWKPNEEQRKAMGLIR